MAPRSDNSRRLARAGWSIVSTSPEPIESAISPKLEAEGERLVSEVARSWTNIYLFTIVKLGFDGQSSFHYECIFSCPTTDKPVPGIILATRFAIVDPGAGADPRLFYSFEEGDLRHEWALVRDASGCLRASQGQQFSLAEDHFQEYIDRVIAEKDRVRERGIDLKTAFEESRLKEASVMSSAYGVTSASQETCDANSDLGADEDEPTEVPKIAVPQTEPGMTEGFVAAGLYCEKVDPPSSLADLLANIFDAADEANVGELPHHEVAKLLSATLPGFGLELWDIHLLLTCTQENDDGFIECKPFVQTAPELIQSLRKRRQTFRNRGLSGIEIPEEHVKHCFADEVTMTTTLLMKLFEQCAQDHPMFVKFENHHHGQTLGGHHHHHGRHGSKHHRASISGGNGGMRPSLMDGGMGMGGDEEQELESIKRRYCQECLASLPERISPQECMRLMQMLPEDEDGYLHINEVHDYLEHLRTEAMLNALVESDQMSLRTHLVLRFRHLGLQQDGKMKLWVIKHALLQADQICLSRHQIHLLLCLAEPDTYGLVDISDFLGMCCVVIPHMFDAKKFVETAEQLILEHAEAMRHAENAELAALGASRVGQLGQDGEESQEKTEVDQETVERILDQLLKANAIAHQNTQALPPESIWNTLQSNEKEVQSTQLSSFELYGFCAEMTTDADGLCMYADHIKKWVPIIFEMRKNKLLYRYMELGSAEQLGIEAPDKDRLEAMFPLLPRETAPGQVPRGSRRRSNAHSGSERHDSHTEGRSSSKRAGSKESGRLSSKEFDEHGHERHPNRILSKRNSVGSGAPSMRQKEVPPGRGYARRKARVEEARLHSPEKAH
jgi:Ca2+-binding EF-hand superfamily protein